MDRTDIVEQLVADRRFCRWVREPDPQLEQYWSVWLAEHPEHAGAAEEARGVVLAMDFRDDLREEEIHTAWDKLQSAIGTPSREESPAPGLYQERAVGQEQQFPVRHPASGLKTVWKKYTGIAAAVAVVLCVSVLLLKRTNYTVYTTGYGERQRIELPDGSVAMLNANSSLRLANDWEKRGVREVEITGEAYFSVVHTVDDQQFTVRTEDGMQVEVLGTEFNVYERESRQRVVLAAGSVQLRYDDLQDGKPILMKPGEMVVKRSSGTKPEKTKVNPSLYSSWTRGLLIFEDTPVAEVRRVMEEQFGIRIVLGDTALDQRLFNGTFPADSAGILLKALSTTYGLKQVRSDGIIRLEPGDSPRGNAIK